MKGKSYDVCVIGSGAGAGPVAYTLSTAGYQVLVLEKGPWFKEADFSKDELAFCRRSIVTPQLADERHVLVEEDSKGEWQAESTEDSGRDFWNGNVVGGSSNFMSGYFYRLKPFDFKLLSTFGPISGANIADWPIEYADLEPYYDKVEKLVGVSGRVVPHPQLEPRSSPEFPFPPTLEHPLAEQIDQTCRNLGLHPLPAARAVLPFPALNRGGCSYSGYCGSYGCNTGAKGSSRAALLDLALKSGNLEIRERSMVRRLVSDQKGKVIAAEYLNAQGEVKQVSAKIFVIACQAIETSRLLLLSTGPRHPAGLGNEFGQVGKNLLFSGGGSGSGDLLFSDFSAQEIEKLKTFGPFLNRGLQDWYVINDKEFGAGKFKGGLVEFDFQHPNPINRANRLKWDRGRLLWGPELKKKLKSYFTEAKHLRFEVFNDWLPLDNCNVSLDPQVKDRWGLPVARVKLGYHEHDLKVGNFIAKKVVNIFQKLGAKNLSWDISGEPPSNLQAGGARFGQDPKLSVLDPNCRIHNCPNTYITDASFMPTGGSVPYTFTIYANSFRVAAHLQKELAGTTSEV